MLRELHFNSISAHGSLSKPTFAIIPPVYVDRFRLVNANIPLSYNIVGDHNNQIAFVKQGDGIVRFAKITPGNYTAGNIVEAIKEAFESAGGQTFTATVDYNTSVLTISAEQPFKILSGKSGSTSWSILGISRNQDTPFGTQIVLPNILDLSGNTPLLLTSSILSSPYSTYVTAPEVNVLAMILTQGEQGGWVVAEGSGNYLYCGTQLQQVDFSILDSATMLPVDFNGLPFSLTLAILDDQDDIA